MKIRCKRCGKAFDVEMYSGICPKCGTYNASRRNDGAPARGTKIGLPKCSPVFIGVILAAILIPLVDAIVFDSWKRNILEEVVKTEENRREEAEKGILILYPPEKGAAVTVKLSGLGTIRGLSTVPERQMLVAIKAEAGSDFYDFDAALSGIYLKYESEGNVFYTEPVSSYYMEESLEELGLPEEELLHTYSVGNGRKESGYWFFCVDEDAEILELQLELINGKYGEVPRTLAEGVVNLKGLPELSFMEGRQE